MERLPINAHVKELINSPQLNEMLPVNFPNGKSLLEFGGECAGCGKEIPAPFLRGKVVFQLDTLVLVEAVGICNECRLATPFRVRVRDDLSMEYVSRSGQWLRSYPGGHVELIGADTDRPSIRAKVRSLAIVSFVFCTIFLPIIIALIWLCRIHG